MPNSRYRKIIDRIASTSTYRREAALTEFVADLSARMVELGLDQKTLAERLECSAARVSQVLRGDGNVTLKTLVDFAMATNGVVHIHIADPDVATRWIDEARGRRKATPRRAPHRSAHRPVRASAAE